MADTAYRRTCDEEVALNNNAHHNDVKFSPKARRQRSSKTSRIFFAIVVLLFLSCITLIVLYSMERARNLNKDGERVDTKGNRTCVRDGAICSSKYCVHVASDIMRRMDTDVDPCEDFFLYACGGWIKSNPIPDSRSAWNQMTTLKNHNEQLLKRLVEDPDIRKQYVHNEAVQKAFNYFDACADKWGIESAAHKPILKVIQDYGSWKVTNKNWTENSWDFMATLVKMQKELNLSPFFKFTIAADQEDSSRYTISLDQTEHAITREAYLGNTSYDNKVRSAYNYLMREIFGALGGDVNAIPEIYDFERSLSAISAPGSQRAERSKIYKSMNIRELTQITNNQIDWLKFFQSILADVSYGISEDEKIAVFAADYLVNMANLTANTPKSTLANYMMWQAVVQLSRYVGGPIRLAIRMFDRAILGNSEEIGQKLKCIMEMSKRTNEIGFPLGVVYVGETFDEKSRAQVKAMIRDLKETFVGNLDDLDWMDEETRKYAKIKANAIRENIGYPDSYVNQKEFSDKYKEFHVVNDSYFDNVLSQRAFSKKVMLSNIQRPVDKRGWFIPPQTVNAFYDHVTNKIIFPAGFLQPPFYDRTFPRAVSYGGLGLVVAHEITHGFDSNGRKYDENGDFVNWWTTSSNEAFVKKSKCFEKQYSNYEIYGKKLNGMTTLGENIADNGAVKQAFMAYKKWIKENGEELELPAINLTNEQLFFVSAAQVDCGSTRKLKALQYIDVATHTIDEWRVIGEMSNSPEFTAAFKCPAGSAMNPKDKCRIW